MSIQASHIAVRIDNNVNVQSHGALREVVEESIATHVGEQPGQSSVRVNLDVLVENCGVSDGLAIATMVVTGRVGDDSIHRRVSSRRQPLHVQGGGAVAGIAGAIVATAVSAAVSAAAKRAFGTDEAAKRLEACVAECLADICIAIDEVAGRTETRSSTRWQKVQWIRWAAAAIAATATVGYFIYHRGARGIPYALMFSFFPAAASFWIVHVFALATMPRGFFLNEPRGRKAMARSGVSSIIAMRILCTVLGAIFIVILICSGMLFWGVINESAD